MDAISEIKYKIMQLEGHDRSKGLADILQFVSSLLTESVLANERNQQTVLTKGKDDSTLSTICNEEELANVKESTHDNATREWERLYRHNIDNCLLPTLPIGTTGTTALKVPDRFGRIREELKVINLRQIIRRAKQAGRRKNILTSSMIREATTDAIARVKHYKALYGEAQEVDIDAIQRANDKKKAKPLEPNLEGVDVVGFRVMTFGDKRPSYLAFTIPGWGSWFPCIDPSSDVHGITRASLIGFLDTLCGMGIPLVYYGRKQDRLLNKALGHRAPDMNVPPMLNMQNGKWSPPVANEEYGRIDTSENSGKTIEEVIWKDLKIDVITWMIHADNVRLRENPPKYPVKYSFNPEWALRREQMIYLSIQSILPLVIYYRKVRESQ